MQAQKKMTDDQFSWPWLKSYPANIQWDSPLAVRPVFENLYETSVKFASRPAFDFLDRKWTWAQVRDLVDRMAAGLQKQGVGKGVRVGLFLPNTLYSLVAYYAILRAGGIVVNFNPLYAPRELENQIEDSGTEIMVTLDLKALYGRMHDMTKTTRLKRLIVCPFTDILPWKKSVLFRLFKGAERAAVEYSDNIISFRTLIANDGKPAPVTIDMNKDVAVLQYTGGTTGTPKGAALTHANISVNVEQTVHWFNDFEPGRERVMGCLPFFHVFAMTIVMNMSVRCGFEIIALPRFDLDETMKIISRKKPGFFPAVPAICNAINHHPRLKDFDLSSIKRGIAGGAPMPVEVKRLFEENTGAVVVEGYGLTESSPVACANPINGVNKPGSIGMPIPGTIIEILDLETRTRPVKQGERGELCLRGPQVMQGYWNKPEETANVLTPDSRLHTGDVAVMDEDGYFYIVDRIKDMIITNGYNVYPRNVEDAIYQHTGVEECIVAGLPDEARGETVKAWIKPKTGVTLTADGVKEFLKDKISPIEIPRQIEFRDTPLPKTAVGKLSRKDLLAQEKAAGKIE